MLGISLIWALLLSLHHSNKTMQTSLVYNLRSSNQQPAVSMISWQALMPTKSVLIKKDPLSKTTMEMATWAVTLMEMPLNLTKKSVVFNSHSQVEFIRSEVLKLVQWVCIKMPNNRKNKSSRISSSSQVLHLFKRLQIKMLEDREYCSNSRNRPNLSNSSRIKESYPKSKCSDLQKYY